MERGQKLNDHTEGGEVESPEALDQRGLLDILYNLLHELLP